MPKKKIPHINGILHNPLFLRKNLIILFFYGAKLTQNPNHYYLPLPILLNNSKN